MTFVLTALAQEETRTRREPVRYIPSLEQLTGDTTKGKPGSENPAESFTSSFGGLYNPSVPPEVARANAIGNVPVNLYIGAPSINLPIYTLTEGRLSVPLNLNYYHAMVKPTAVAGWTGLGWELNGIPTLTRMVRGFPDEGYLEENGSAFIGRKGFFFFGNALNASDSKQDKEPDYFFINTPSGSGKFIFDGWGKARFFPESDIKVEAVAEPNASDPQSPKLAYRFKQFVATFPDGVKYYFSSSYTEDSGEVEVKKSRTDQVYPGGSNFVKFITQNVIPSAWSCVKIESPYGEKLDFTYDRVAYSYYRLAENEGASSYCPVAEKKINKVYVRSSLIRSIKSSHIEVLFNTGHYTCTMDTTTNELVCGHTGLLTRNDLDGWGNSPEYYSTSARTLKSITIKDLSDPENTTSNLFYNFNYSYFTSSEEILPAGYSIGEVGTTHRNKLKLASLASPGGETYQFTYDESASSNHSRFTYGVDHWGYQNTSSLGDSYIGRDDLQSCGAYKEPNIDFGKNNVLTKIIHSTGSETSFEYESHTAKNYVWGVGGLRLKSSVAKDAIRGQSIKKNYTYTLADNSSSGFLFIKPIYRMNYAVQSSPQVMSYLYDYLIAESGRPAVGYGRVTETTTDIGGINQPGKMISYFDQEETVGRISFESTCPPGPAGCAYNVGYFNLRQPDLRGGQLLKTETFNQANALIQKTENTYNSGTGNVWTVACVNRHQKSTQNFPYYTNIRRHRLKSQTSTVYGLGGGGIPVISTVTYTYKDEMPEAYRTKYRGIHQMPVLTATEDEDGNIYESRILYTADFNFDADTLYSCYTDIYCPGNYSCPMETCSYMEIVTHVPPYGSDARGIFESVSRNILFTPVENRQLINSQTVSAGYVGLVSTATSGLTLPRASYSLKQVPKTDFQEVYYRKSDNTMVRDADYGNVADALVLSHNIRGHVTESKINKGPSAQSTYLNNVVPNGSTSNFGKPDALSQSVEFGKFYLGVNKSVSSNLLENRIEKETDSGRITAERDRNNNIIRRYDYKLNPGSVSLISWNEPAATKTCSGGNVTLNVYVSGLHGSAIAQFSTNGGSTWTNANVGSHGFTFTRPAATGTQEIRARASDNTGTVITTSKDISCDAPVAFNWGPYSVATLEAGPPRVCQYNVSVVGLSSGGTAQFSIDNGTSWLNANVGTTQMQYALYANPSIQEFWARDSNNPSNVIYGTLNVCN